MEFVGQFSPAEMQYFLGEVKFSGRLGGEGGDDGDDDGEGCEGFEEDNEGNFGDEF